MKKAETEESKAVTLLRQRFLQMITDLHDRDARPLMNARQMLTMYIEQFGPALPKDKLDLLMRISDELDKAVTLHKNLQLNHQSE